MTLTAEPIPVPFRTDEGGTIRIGKSRVTLDVVIREFERGADPESIVHAYPTLQLDDVYAVITYYLRNREAVDSYLQSRRAEAEELRKKIEARQGSQSGLRPKLLARREPR